MGEEVIVKFIKKDNGISVSVDNATSIEVLLGLAETIQLLAENTDATEKDVIKEINKILKILNEK